MSMEFGEDIQVKLEDLEIISNDNHIQKNDSIKAVARFLLNDYPEKTSYQFLGIGISNSQKTAIQRASKLIKYRIEN